MTTPLLTWDIYEVTTKESIIQGVMFRGRVRKYALQNNRNILAENATDAKNIVRFALPHGESAQDIIEFILTMIPDASVKKFWENIANPVLSKMIVNFEERYTI